jgi:recombination protein RecR
MTPFEKLEKLFTKFPGIGRRQAKRFAYFIVQSNPDYIAELQESITGTKKTVKLCPVSFQYFTTEDPTVTTSPIVRDETRDHSIIMLVEKDQDIEAFEKSQTYHGQYFVLGSLNYLLDTEIDQSTRVHALLALIEKRAKESGITEIIFALPANPDGDRISQTLQEKMAALQERFNFRISQLGRGFSTGAEVEYADAETLNSALENRK